MHGRRARCGKTRRRRRFGISARGRVDGAVLGDRPHRVGNVINVLHHICGSLVCQCLLHKVIAPVPHTRWVAVNRATPGAPLYRCTVWDARTDHCDGLQRSCKPNRPAPDTPSLADRAARLCSKRVAGARDSLRQHDVYNITATVCVCTAHKKHNGGYCCGSGMLLPCRLCGSPCPAPPCLDLAAAAASAAAAPCGPASSKFFCGVRNTTLATLDAKASDDRDSVACTLAGETLQNMSALESPPSESCMGRMKHFSTTMLYNSLYFTPAYNTPAAAS